MRFEGGAELAETLRGLSTRMSKSVLRDALRVGVAEPIQSAARAAAAKAPGAPDIASHIAISAARGDRTTATLAVGPSTDTRSDQPERRFDVQGRLLEFGTIYMAAQPFMRPAFDAEAAASLPRISGEMWRALASRGFSTRSSPSGGGLL